MSSRRTLFLLCLVLLVGIVGPVQGTAGAQDLSAVELEPNDCEFLVQGAEDPRPRLGDISCGTLDVPENWNEPEGRRIQIGYAVLEATGEAPEADPIVFLAGGPGTSPLTSIEAYASIFAPLRETRDIVIFDQRGARLSSPLRCEDYSAVLGVDLPPEVTEAAGVPPAGPPSDAADLDAEALLQAAREQFGPAAQACVAEATAKGADLSQYNSISNANDVVALVKALGYDAYNLYSISYGTRLALEVMRSHPESGLRSVVLDSTYPPEIPSYEQFPLEPHEVVIQLFADCQRDANCAAAHPDLQNRFVALLAQLREQPIGAADGRSVSDRELIAVMQTLGGNIQAVPYVPAMIAELERGETATFEGIASGSLFDVPDAEASPEADEATPTEDPIASFSPSRQLVLGMESAILAQPDGNVHQVLRELDSLPHTRQSLLDVIGRMEQPELLAAADALSDTDVEQVFSVIEQEITLADVRTVGVSVPQFYSIECNERIPFQSLADMVTFAQDLAIPELALGVPETFAKVFAICESWPSGRASDETQQRIWSSVATLVLAGAYDNLTPVSWNKSAFTTLPNGVFVLAPMAGHGVITFSSCAQDVATAFVTDPFEPLDATCFEELTPDWALPA
ncbi:MAG: alpha/beta hydrolase [Thermomicrobiales bacterium]